MILFLVMFFFGEEIGKIWLRLNICKLSVGEKVREEI